MKASLFSFSILTLLFCVSLNVQAQSPQPSYFTKALVSSILQQPGCKGLRIYPVLDIKSSSNTTMVIGIDESGKEIYNAGSAASEYQMFANATDNVVHDAALNQDQARAACQGYKASTGFVSDITSQILNGFLGENSSGIYVSYSSDGGQNFSVSGYTDQGGLKSVGNSVAGSPCPRMCGDNSNYLCSPQ